MRGTPAPDAGAGVLKGEVEDHHHQPTTGASVCSPRGDAHRLIVAEDRIALLTEDHLPAIKVRGPGPRLTRHSGGRRADGVLPSLPSAPVVAVSLLCCVVELCSGGTSLSWPAPRVVTSSPVPDGPFLFSKRRRVYPQLDVNVYPAQDRFPRRVGWFASPFALLLSGGTLRMPRSRSIVVCDTTGWGRAYTAAHTGMP